MHALKDGKQVLGQSDEWGVGDSSGQLDEGQFLYESDIWTEMCRVQDNPIINTRTSCCQYRSPWTEKTETIIKKKKKVLIPLWNTENLREEEGIVEEEVGRKMLRFCPVDSILQTRAVGLIWSAVEILWADLIWKGDGISRGIRSRLVKMVRLLMENGLWKDKIKRSVGPLLLVHEAAVMD